MQEVANSFLSAARRNFRTFRNVPRSTLTYTIPATICLLLLPSRIEFANSSIIRFPCKARLRLPKRKTFFLTGDYDPRCMADLPFSIPGDARVIPDILVPYTRNS